MSKAASTLVGIFGAIITLAIISVIISRKSRAPEAIQAISSGMANVVRAAVAPVNTSMTNGNLGANTFTTPAGTSPGGFGPVPMQY